ncbi:MAG: hypothetical protein KGJ07_00045 [Patescibacteria group bacterium]|nr:hypothetical protein [Patescibacteria group bacterium]
MIEAYKIAVNMTLTGDANKKLMEFSRLVDKTTKGMDKLLRSVMTLNQFFRETRNHLQAINPALKMFDRSMSTIATDMRRTNGSMSFFNDMLMQSSRNTQQLRYQTNTLRNSMNSLAAAGRHAGNSVRSVRGMRGGGGGGGANLANAGMMGLALEYAAPAAIAYAGYNLEKESYSKYAEYTSQLAITKGMGYGQNVVNQVQRATEIGKPNLSPLTQIHAYNAALMATQSPEKAAKIFPTLATAMSFAPTIFGNLNKRQLEQAVRGAEVLAGGDEKQLISSFSDILGMMYLSGGTLMPSDIRHMVRKNPSLSRLGLMELEPVAQEMGGEKVSTALQTGRMQLTKGQMGRPQAAMFHKLGIIGMPEYDPLGHSIGSKYGNMSADKWKLYNENPTEFLKQVILPAFAKNRITSQEEIMKMISFLFSNTTGVFFQNIYKNLSKSNSIRAREKNIPGIEGMASISPEEDAAIKRTSEAFDTFRIALGHLTAPGITKGLNIVSRILEDLAKGMNIMMSGTVNPTIVDTRNSSNDLTFANIFGITNTSGANAFKGAMIKGDVYISAKKMGSWVGNAITPSANVEHGQTGYNPAHHGMSTAVPNNQGTFSS